MKRPISFLGTLLLTLCLYGQNSVTLSINHLLGEEAFVMEMETKNNLDQDFYVSRLEYYLSGFKIIHDGGQELSLPELYALINANEDADIDMGEHDVNVVEAIKMSVGVDIGNNHEDPAQWPWDHPLAPKNPSMHWGWVGGYRFVAIEGQGGSRFNQPFELHGLGNDNYFEITLPFNVSAQNGTVELSINADYTRILEDIQVASGVLVHGDYDEAKQALENMRDFVFTPAVGATSSRDLLDDSTYDVYPNPSFGEPVSVQLTNGLIDRVEVVSLSGQSVLIQNGINRSTFVIHDLDQGSYLVRLISSNGESGVKKIVVK